MESVPVIDLGGLGASVATSDDVPTDVLATLVGAAERFGFFQVANVGIQPELIERVFHATRAFFALPMDDKRKLARTADQSRGYYDRELTKQRRDLKEVLDISHVPHPELAADDERNFQAIDGPNRWPELDGFQPTMLEWLAACEQLSLRLLGLFAVALGEAPAMLQSHFGADHTSFVRLNHYPDGDVLTEGEAAGVTPLGDMALHHHSDAGALTVLLQDDVGGLQVESDGEWIDVDPVPGALVINTGDMMQVWSNDRFPAALHRVAPTVAGRERYSLPYFFNPSYSTDYAPLPGSVGPGERPHYRPLNWGDFRKSRADGDFADYGTEIQISQFRTGSF